MLLLLSWLASFHFPLAHPRSGSARRVLEISAIVLDRAGDSAIIESKSKTKVRHKFPPLIVGQTSQAKPNQVKLSQANLSGAALSCSHMWDRSAVLGSHTCSESAVGTVAKQLRAQSRSGFRVNANLALCLMPDASAQICSSGSGNSCNRWLGKCQM